MGPTKEPAPGRVRIAFAPRLPPHIMAGGYPVLRIDAMWVTTDTRKPGPIAQLEMIVSKKGNAELVFAELHHLGITIKGNPQQLRELADEARAAYYAERERMQLVAAAPLGLDLGE